MMARASTTVCKVQVATKLTSRQPARRLQLGQTRSKRANSSSQHPPDTMLPRLAVRTSLRLPQRALAAQRTFATSSPRLLEAKEAILHHKAETTPEAKSEEDSLGLTENQERGLQQAPNRTEIWSRSQRPRAKAMTGPRFEQTEFDLQVRIVSSMDTRCRLTHV